MPDGALIDNDGHEFTRDPRGSNIGGLWYRLCLRSFMERIGDRDIAPGLLRRDGFSLLIGGAVLLVLVAFAWRYYLERTACFDSSFISWLLFDQRLPQSVLGRYSAWIPQLVPVALIRGGASLETVLRAYSVCIALFHVVIYLLVAWRLRDRAAVIALPIMLVAGFHYMFYYGFSELYQGLSVLLLLWVCCRRFLDAASVRERWKWALLALMLAMLLPFYHQLLVLPLVFMLLMEAMERKVWRDRGLRILSLVMVIWFAVRILTMSSSTYEQARMPTVHDLLHYSTRLDELASTQHLLMVWTKFRSLLILIAVAMVLLVLRRKWLLLAWSICWTSGFLVLTLITDRDGGSPTIYENYYPVIGVVWAMVFAGQVVAPLRSRTVLVVRAVQVCVLALGLLQIHRGHHRISFKVEYAQRLTRHLSEQGTPKAYGNMVNYPWVYALGYWPLGMETALVASVPGPEHTATYFITPDTAQAEVLLEDPNLFMGPSWALGWFTIDHLEPHYFQLPVDRGYVRVNNRDTTGILAGLSASDIDIAAAAAPVRLVPDRYTVVLLRITDRAGNGLPSRVRGGGAVQFTCTLFRPDGTIYQEQERTSLEIDIPPFGSYDQGLVVERPRDPGTYRVEAALVMGDSLLGPRVTFTVEAARFGL